VVTGPAKKTTTIRLIRLPDTLVWAVVWSSLFSFLFMRTLHSDRCFAIVSGKRLEWTIGALAWLWLFVFFSSVTTGV